METCQKLLEFPAAKKLKKTFFVYRFNTRLDQKSLPVVADAHEMEDVFLSQNSFFALLSLFRLNS